MRAGESEHAKTRTGARNTGKPAKPIKAGPERKSKEKLKAVLNNKLSTFTGSYQPE